MYRDEHSFLKTTGLRQHGSWHSRNTKYSTFGSNGQPKDGCLGSVNSRVKNVVSTLSPTTHLTGTLVWKLKEWDSEHIYGHTLSRLSILANIQQARASSKVFLLDFCFWKRIRVHHLQPLGDVQNYRGSIRKTGTVLLIFEKVLEMYLFW